MPKRGSLAIARMRWGILERGISGDLDEQLPAEERTARATRILAEYVEHMAAQRWPELLPMALTVLQDLAKAEDGGDPEGKVDAHQAALDHFRVPELSQSGADGQRGQEPGDGPPDYESGAHYAETLRGYVERASLGGRPLQHSLLSVLDVAPSEEREGSA